jgi:hypothetical protein
MQFFVVERAADQGSGNPVTRPIGRFGVLSVKRICITTELPTAREVTLIHAAKVHRRVDAYVAPSARGITRPTCTPFLGQLEMTRSHEQSRSQWIVAKGSYHWVQIYRPELVVAAVQEIVNDRI